MAKIEEVFDLNVNQDKKVVKVIQDDNLDYIHMRFMKDGGLPVHVSNSNVYMTVLHGTLTIGLGVQDPLDYPSGTLLKIPYKTQMDVRNLHDEILELLVIKAPPPRSLIN